MEGMLPNNGDFTLARDLGKLLDDHKGGDVVVLDMRSINYWTDFFVIATATSNTHLYGLQRHVKDFARERGIEILRRSKKPDNSVELNSQEQHSDEWCLLDLGSIVIHLMSDRLRSFFELERLWSAATLIYGKSGDSGTKSSHPHSSKSS